MLVDLGEEPAAPLVDRAWRISSSIARVIDAMRISLGV
jgi:hypothetical protein